MNAQQAAENALAERTAVLSSFANRTADAATDLSMQIDQVKSLRKLVGAAEVIVWESDIFSLASSQYEAFDGLRITSVAFPNDVQFWSFDGFDIGRDDELMPDNYYCGGIVFIPGRYFTERTQPVVVYLLYPEVSGLPIKFKTQKLTDPLTMGSAQVAALCAFMGLKLAVKEPVLPPRAMRRRAQKNGEHVPEIRIIQLRERKTSQDRGGNTREYHHKWIVKGHWRRLHEPRKLDGAEITFVHAYVKGDGPLLPPRESVYVVAR